MNNEKVTIDLSDYNRLINKDLIYELIENILITNTNYIETEDYKINESKTRMISKRECVDSDYILKQIAFLYNIKLENKETK